MNMQCKVQKGTWLSRSIVNAQRSSLSLAFQCSKEYAWLAGRKLNSASPFRTKNVATRYDASAGLSLNRSPLRLGQVGYSQVPGRHAVNYKLWKCIKT